MTSMDVRPIRSEADYDWALREIGQYFVKEPRRAAGFLSGKVPR